MPEPLTIKVAEELAEKLRQGYSSKGRVTFWLEGDVMICREDDQGWPAKYPHYYSTYCIHELHDDCRLTCKHCPERCRCDCHQSQIHKQESGQP